MGTEAVLTAACLWMSELGEPRISYTDVLRRRKKTPSFFSITVSLFLIRTRKRELAIYFIRKRTAMDCSHSFEKLDSRLYSAYSSKHPQTHAAMDNRLCLPGFCSLPSSTLSMIQCKIPG